jgi:hypothetical protein
VNGGDFVSPKIVPEGHKQINIILPEETIKRLDEICKAEKRKRPGQLQYMIENWEGKSR